MREQIRNLIHDAQRRATIAADCLESPGSQELGGQAIRLAHIATALHLSQAAPLLRSSGAPPILSRHQATA